MYAIFDISTSQLVCEDQAMRTPKMAWDFFQVKWPELRQAYGDRELDWENGEHRQLFECRLVGERARVARLAGHAMQTSQTSSGIEGQCVCGWTACGETPKAILALYHAHLEESGLDRTPRPAENLPAAARVARSLDRLKEEGGGRKTFRLPKPAIEELDRMVQQENFRDHTAALTSVLMTRSVPAPAPAENAALYAMHIDDPEVEQAVDEAVRLLCRELDSLFPGAAPDGGKGVGSNFQGLMVEHVKAMLTGKNQARRSHHTHLPVLLADDNAFGQPFALPNVQGAGYVVVNPTKNQVLSAYSGRFVPAYRGRAGQGTYIHMVPLFDFDKGGILPEDAPVSAYEGKELHFTFEADILFSTHEAATQAALKALRDEDESPASLPLTIVAASYVCEKDCFVMHGRHAGQV
jgi:hypothetical protein